MAAASVASTNRACKECKRKKTKCDGEKPRCSLCRRVGMTCIYPRRKPRTLRRAAGASGAGEDKSSSHASVTTAWDLPELGTPLPAAYDVMNLPDAGNDSVDGYAGLDTSMWSFTQNDFSAIDHNPGSASTTCQQVDPAAQQPVPPGNGLPDLLNMALDSASSSGLHRHDETALHGASGGSESWSEEANNDAMLSPASSIMPSWLPAMVAEDSGPAEDILRVPSVIVNDLIECYFRRVQVFLPLFHQPTFYKTHLRDTSEQGYFQVTRETMFVVYGMMALSARYSTLPHLVALKPCDRGAQYMREARAIFAEAFLNEESGTCSLVWLQGCILLAYYNQSCKLARGTDVFVPTCVKFAYELNLQAIDEDESETDWMPCLDSSAIQDWIGKEERRRAWWSIWELDAFDSVALRQPFTIDCGRIHVFLPVSDEAWFSGTPTRSAKFNANIRQCWKVLTDTPNSDERAWFLLSNYIAVRAFELCQHRRISQQSINDIDTVIGCFSLLFYEKFNSNPSCLPFDETTYARSNWIILTRLMIISARITVCLLNTRSSEDPILSTSSCYSKSPERSLSEAGPLPATCLETSYQCASEAFRILQSWSPAFIKFVPPTMACMLTGPAAFMLRYARHLRSEQNDDGGATQFSIQEDLILLILRQFARYWNIGICLLDFAHAFHQKRYLDEYISIK